jgi:CRP-like cAMP-binding protein
LVRDQAAMAKKRKNEKLPVFDAQAFLDSAGVARKVVEYRSSQKVYSQGGPATSVMYVQKGGVKLGVVNEVGKEAVLAILGPGDFFGEGSMAGQSVRMAERLRVQIGARQNPESRWMLARLPYLFF